MTINKLHDELEGKYRYYPQQQKFLPIATGSVIHSIRMTEPKFSKLLIHTCYWNSIFLNCKYESHAVVFELEGLTYILALVSPTIAVCEIKLPENESRDEQ